MKRACLAASLGAVLVSCAFAPRGLDTLVTTPETVLIVVPAVQQTERDACGLAALATLCAYHDVSVPDELRARLAARAEEREGLSGGDLRAALHELGLEAFLFQGSLDWEATGLYRHVDRGRAPLVMISSDGERRHTCLFTGYDPSTGSVYLYDPRRGHLRIAEDDFTDLWENARRFTLLALPPFEPPHEHLDDHEARAVPVPTQNSDANASDELPSAPVIGQAVAPRSSSRTSGLPHLRRPGALVTL